MTPTAIQPTTYGRNASLARFSVAQYQKMIETGILTAADKVELLENYVVLKMSRNPPHASTIQRMMEALFRIRPDGWSWRSQSAIMLPDSQPEPDFALVRGSWEDYETQHPRPADTALVIEVADSSIQLDQREKARIYARASIPAYWVVNLVDNRLEVYTLPSGPTSDPGFEVTQKLAPGDEVSIFVDGVSGTPMPVADLLPKKARRRRRS